MNKHEIIDTMAQEAGISKTEAEKALKAFTDTVTTELSTGNDVVLVGFGSFTTGERAAREGRNPQTGETIQIKASRVAKFKPGKKLKDAVNETV